VISGARAWISESRRWVVVVIGAVSKQVGLHKKAACSINT